MNMMQMKCIFLFVNYVLCAINCYCFCICDA